MSVPCMKSSRRLKRDMGAQCTNAHLTKIYYAMLKKSCTSYTYIKLQMLHTLSLHYINGRTIYRTIWSKFGRNFAAMEFWSNQTEHINSGLMTRCSSGLSHGSWGEQMSACNFCSGISTCTAFVGCFLISLVYLDCLNISLLYLQWVLRFCILLWPIQSLWEAVLPHCP